MSVQLELFPRNRCITLVSRPRNESVKTQSRLISDFQKPPTIYDMNCPKCSHFDVSTPMTKRKAAQDASQDPSFETARNDSHRHLTILACEATLSEESAPIATGVATVVYEDSW